MRLFKAIGLKLKELSPAAIREIIIITLILCLSIVLSLPQYGQDREKLRLWNETQEKLEVQDSINQ